MNPVLLQSTVEPADTATVNHTFTSLNDLSSLSVNELLEKLITQV